MATWLDGSKAIYTDKVVIYIQSKREFLNTSGEKDFIFDRLPLKLPSGNTKCIELKNVQYVTSTKNSYSWTATAITPFGKKYVVGISTSKNISDVDNWQEVDREIW